MSVAAAVGTPAAGRWWFGQKIADWSVGFIVFLGAFVIAEPAPYELLLAPVIVVWAFFGLRLNRHMLPMIVLMVLYLTGGFLALTQLTDLSKGPTYMAVTTFLVVSSIFFAAVIAEAPERRFLVIKHAYIASAVIASLIGIAGYFHLVSGADAFLLYGRVKSTFQDPNVFGPFLVLPIVMLYRDILTGHLHQSLWKGSLLLVLMLALFLAFSRAAWGMTALAILLVTLMSYLTTPRSAARLRIVFYFAAGALLIALLIVAALSIPAVQSLFEDRATLVETYDAGEHGRFGRHAVGFFLVQEHPLGLGPFVFARLLGEDEHNMWLKGFTTYGWIGGFAYLALALWTLVAAAPLIFKPRPWQPIVQCVYAVFIGHLMIHNVIDNDHWRHVFLIYGMLWGAIAAEKMVRREHRRPVAADGPLVFGPVTLPRAAPAGIR